MKKIYKPGSVGRTDRQGTWVHLEAEEKVGLVMSNLVTTSGKLYVEARICELKHSYEQIISTNLAEKIRVP